MTTLTKQIQVKNANQLPIAIGQVIQVEEEEIAIFKISNGHIYAIENKSPHPKGGRLADGLVSGHYLFCPIHDWKISLIDGQVQEPDQGLVKTFTVEMIGADLVIKL